MRKTLAATTTALTLTLAALCAGAVELTTEVQRYSYALGHQATKPLQQSGLEIDAEAFTAAVRDVLKGAAPQLTPEEMAAAKQQQVARLQAQRQALAARNASASEAFLAANRQQEGISELPSGLQYRVETAGEGPMPGPTDTVLVNYKGMLPDGTEFDSSYSRGQPATFALNRVIKGFQEALTKMKVGEKWTIFVPPALGYGERGAGRMIGPNQALTFEIELLEIRQ